MAVLEEIELPDQIPDVLQSGIHPLPSKCAMNVSGVAGYEDSSDAQSRCVPVMDAKIAAPVKGACLDPGWRPLVEDLPDEVQRWSVSFRLVYCCHDTPPVGAHGKNGDRPEFTGA